MKKLINSIGFYFLFPIYFALALLFTFFNVPQEYYFSLFILCAIITVPVLLSLSLFPLKMRINEYYRHLLVHPKYRFITLSLCFFIFICGPVDVYVNGFKLLNPSTYAETNGIGRYIRHITTLCWIFVPVAFLFLKSRGYKLLFISYALLFPIVIIDRNRFFLSGYSLFLCAVLVFNASDSLRPKKGSKLLYWFIPLICLFIFSLIGHFRSGAAFIVPSSGSVVQAGAYPLKASFASLPALLQQIILYITTPIFNFATIASENFINQHFLISQFSPFSRENLESYLYAPTLVARYTVGTEFYPFLLYGGLAWVAWAFVFMLIGFILACSLFKKCPNVFTFLIFIKISYNALFMGFAPQFYILLNLIFLSMMFFLWFFAELIRISKILTVDKAISGHDLLAQGLVCSPELADKLRGVGS
ncbi:hypothetical protein [Legionella maceachernii]|uniref:Transmembrane protein n=1 Tax=Legionella maceachernii TaxID=466 RepID=A0A0W0WD63_9GAMM|nr:hypothetical protein [Legionella maceachernii]KTD30174.1 hypothetical protein Lmac_0671 [Legionella maceachernii]SJZ92940.1 hypothetical protein SAMN02745128_01480 [Legionella maceachernii]SUP03482.1 Uncharacterised protein [Legionella maceachernii]